MKRTSQLSLALPKATYGLWAILILLGLSSCSTDLDVNAPYKQIPVVFAFVDPAATTQYARVQRTFQNRSGDARNIARNERDSVEYKTNEIEVSLWRANGGRVGIYEARELTNKDTVGAFFAPNHRVYALNTPAGTLLPGERYRIVVKRLATNDSTVQAVTQAVGPFNFNLPTNATNLSPSDTISLKTIDITPAAGGKFRIQYWSNCFARTTAINIRVLYEEVTTGGVVTVKDVWYNNAFRQLEPEIRTNCGRGPEPLKGGEISSDALFQALVDSIPAADASVSLRYFRGMEFYVYAASKEVADYQDVNFQFQPITQSVPTYTNIANGLGLFASVRSEMITARFRPNLPNLMNEVSATGQPRYPSLFALKFRTR